MLDITASNSLLSRPRTRRLLFCSSPTCSCVVLVDDEFYGDEVYCSIACQLGHGCAHKACVCCAEDALEPAMLC